MRVDQSATRILLNNQLAALYLKKHFSYEIYKPIMQSMKINNRHDCQANSKTVRYLPDLRLHRYSGVVMFNLLNLF